MANVVHISEAEAARDFAAVMRRVRAGDEVVLEEDGGRVVGVLRSPEAERAHAQASGYVRRIPGKTAEEIIEGFRRWEAEHGPLKVDPAFADDVEEGHRWANGLETRPPERTIEQAIALLDQQSMDRFSPEDDPDFADDMKAVRAIYNAPLDDSKWD